MPLDLNYLAKRLDYMIQNSGITHCFPTSTEEVRIKKLGLFPLGTDVSSRSKDVQNVEEQNDTAYILYTSGSTGTPKGVAMGQRALANLVHWQNSQSKAAEATGTLQFAPLSFDVSFQEIGSTLTTVQGRRRDPFFQRRGFGSFHFIRIARKSFICQSPGHN